MAKANKNRKENRKTGPSRKEPKPRSRDQLPTSIWARIKNDSGADARQ